LTYRVKRACVRLLLLVLLLWPPVHAGLVSFYDLSAWKLSGWGMYSQPRPKDVGMEVYGRTAGGGDYDQLTNASPALQTEANAFLAQHQWLGRLTRPDAFAAAIRHERPDWEALRIVTFRSHMEPDTGMIVLRRTEFDYPPRAPEEPR
jgi:hypothetical protein